ncbi:hypothetical protein K8R42_05485 [bacterium]|nr:hypothetical protein [bacterium]
MDLLFEQIEKLHSESRLSDKAFEAMWWFENNLQHTFMTKELIDEFLVKHFTSLPITQAIDYNFTKDTLWFFFLKPKK